jgi:Arm domain-containing DNA-binding protein
VPKRVVNGLTTRRVESEKRPGLHTDGLGLYLRVVGKAKDWIFRFQIAKRRRDMGLGPAGDVPLAEARELAAEARRLIRQGHDPIEVRRAERSAAGLRDALRDLIEAKTKGQASALRAIVEREMDLSELRCERSLFGTLRH